MSASLICRPASFRPASSTRVGTDTAPPTPSDARDADARDVEARLRAGGHIGEVAAPGAHLMEADADLAGPHRKAHRGSARRRRAGSVIIGPAKKSCARALPGPSAVMNSTSPPSVARTSGISAAGSALATEPPMVPRERVGRWPTHGKRRRRAAAASRGPAGGARPRPAGSAAPMEIDIALVRDSGQFGQPGDVDQARGAREAHGHHRHEGLAAGDDAGVLVGAEHRRRPARGFPAARTRRGPPSCAGAPASAPMAIASCGRGRSGQTDPATASDTPTPLPAGSLRTRSCAPGLRQPGGRCQ